VIDETCKSSINEGDLKSRAKGTATVAELFWVRQMAKFTPGQAESS